MRTDDGTEKTEQQEQSQTRLRSALPLHASVRVRRWLAAKCSGRYFTFTFSAYWLPSTLM